jgi:hypothetical protein
MEVHELYDSHRENLCHLADDLEAEFYGVSSFSDRVLNRSGNEADASFGMT